MPPWVSGVSTSIRRTVESPSIEGEISTVSPSTTLVTVAVVLWSTCPKPFLALACSLEGPGSLSSRTALAMPPKTRIRTSDAPAAVAHPLVFLYLEV